MSDNTNISAELLSAVGAIKAAILQSQARTARNVNTDVLTLNYSVGKYISTESRKRKWGSGAIKTISEQLQKELPGLKGFGESNIKNMRQFFEEWSKIIIGQPTAGETQNIDVEENVNRQPLAGDFETADDNQSSLLLLQSKSLVTAFDIETANNFLSISFTHHMEILNKTESLEERLFYIRQTAANKWDKYKLRDMLKQDLYHHQSALPNNFLLTMPKQVQALKAIDMFKDEYFLDYMNVEELGVRDIADIDERVVEQSIIHNVKNFIMTFGRDFTFVGNQYHLEKYGHSNYPDLLFYNRELAALVVVELKRGEFKPAYLGQLSAYLRILDSEVKKPFENPSIGIILCKQADKNYVEFLIQGYDNPMGVATYKTAEDVRRVLPSEEDLQRVLNEEP